MKTFSAEDLEQMRCRNIAYKSVEQQIEHFKTGFPYLNIIEPATIQNGITSLNQETIKEYVKLYDKFEGSRIKFVPASGAATRMFKKLYDFLAYFSEGGTIHDNTPKAEEARRFFANLERFAFYEKLSALLKKENIKLESITKEQYIRILQLLLSKEGLNFAEKPKGVLEFHADKHSDGSLYIKTAFEEQLIETLSYCIHEKIAKIHLTVSAEHQVLFETVFSECKNDLEKQYGAMLNVTYSVQDKSTDTIAVDLENNPFRNLDNSLLFRPAGHGALLHNLNKIEEKLIFIKTIDNVVPSKLQVDTILYKKVLAGKLLEVVDKINQYLLALDQGNIKNLDSIKQYIECELNIRFPQNLRLTSNVLISILNRPIRVCGMVKNEGELGGGPFWVKNEQGFTTLQIVEQSQFNAGDPKQQNIVKRATHFNPVDLVCYTHDYKGRKFDLQKFVDHQTGFISSKSKDGKMLKALELPGLWNGSMSQWITLFVEVPLTTFNPVKEVFDLLRPEHQNEQ